MKEVHPDLQNFFTLYIEGKNQWKPNDQLKYIGITYHDTLQERDMLSIFQGNDITTKPIGIGLERIVTKAGPNEWAGLKVGDIISVNDYRNSFEPEGQKLKEGEIAKLRVKRNKEVIELEIKVKYGMKNQRNVLKWMNKK